MAPGRSACTPAGPRSPVSAQHCSHAAAFSDRAVCSKVRTASSSVSPTRADYDFTPLTGGFGTTWLMETVAFKPYACGTMIHPYIDCAIRLAGRGIRDDEIVSIECATAEGIVHRLWEPLAGKQTPPNAYAMKFSTPYCMALGFLNGDVGLGAFTDAAAHDPRTRALAAKIHYTIDPENPVPQCVHRPAARDADGWSRHRRAPAALPRRRARAAHRRRDRREVCRERRVRRAGAPRKPAPRAARSGACSMRRSTCAPYAANR